MYCVFQGFVVEGYGYFIGIIISGIVVVVVEVIFYEVVVIGVVLVFIILVQVVFDFLFVVEQVNI